MKTISSKWEKHNQTLDNISSKFEDFISHPYFKSFIIWPLQKNTYIMHREITTLMSIRELWGSTILEIGGGVGNFCRCLHDRMYIKEYTIVDTPSMLRFSRSFLAHYNVPCTFVESTNYKSLKGQKFDLLISNVCISEVPLEYSNSLFDIVLPNCEMVFIIDTNNEEFSNWIEDKIGNVFKSIECVDLPEFVSLQKNHRLYVGLKEED